MSGKSASPNSRPQQHDGRSRKAAAAAAAKARAEQAARDRRNQTIIGVVVVAILVVLCAIVAVTIWRANHPTVDSDQIDAAWAEVQKADPKPSNATGKGGFIISKNGIDKPVKGVPTVATYMDFMCPGCGSMERQLGDTYEKLVEAGQINLEIHPMAFMDRYSTDEYSSRAANAAVEIAESDPDHLMAFISAMYEEDFQPDETDYQPVSNEQIKERALQAGVSEEVATAATDDDYVYADWIAAMSDYTPMRSELWNVSGQLKGQMSTPTITINGTLWNRSAMTGVSQLEGFLKAIGLEESEIGQAGAIPDVGDDKGPLFP